jgi:hypothetical protein
MTFDRASATNVMNAAARKPPKSLPVSPLGTPSRSQLCHHGSVTERQRISHSGSRPYEFQCLEALQRFINCADCSASYETPLLLFSRNGPPETPTDGNADTPELVNKHAGGYMRWYLGKHLLDIDVSAETRSESGGQDKREAPSLSYDMKIPSDFRLLWSPRGARPVMAAAADGRRSRAGGDGTGDGQA